MRISGWSPTPSDNIFLLICVIQTNETSRTAFFQNNKNCGGKGFRFWKRRFSPQKDGLSLNVMQTPLTARVEPIGSNLTEGALALIESVYERTGLNDPQELLPHVCSELEKRFSDNSLEYHLSQMHLQTTADIVRTISCFFISKRLYPDKNYLK